MATSATMQSILSSNLSTRLTNRPRVNQFLPNANHVLRLPRNTCMRVRCKANEEQQASPPRYTPQPPKVISTKFSDVLAFSGPAPERINGRLAMIGFVAAMAVEVSRGQDLFAQISDGGIPWFLGTSILLSFASLIPLFKGVSVESKSKGFMTSDAELWNGRFAMLGLVALAFTEFVKGGGTIV
ncbi:early light-induced protein 1, chloroplastic-like [Juglans microcarpa x Juglans regia]|uniref:early light-induced protein 1, chloroplastic-like n=1 Tax=Juglans microcarpa x Juglans regia TaxID=2249226 RepID=UPI001B7F3E80|nr:early light-induced protein 1, chloroplastic-like [Juglans microcarpa x Juglans regia]